MSEMSRRVLIGDEDKQRADWLSEFLSEYYGLESRIISTLDEALSVVTISEWSFIFLTDTLPYMEIEGSTTEANFAQIRGKIEKSKNYKYTLVCIVTGESNPDWARAGLAPPFHIHLSSPPTNPAGLKAIIDELRSMGNLLPTIRSTEDISNKTRWDKNNRILREQIRSLSLKRDVDDGEERLFSLISNCFNCKEKEKIQIKELGQGKSGAQVFHLIVVPKVDKAENKSARAGAKLKPPEEHYILKLSEAGDSWKLLAEIEGYNNAKKSTAYSIYKKHVPDLKEAYFPKYGKDKTEYKHIASSFKWDAIYYDYLDANVLKHCLALETALISDTEKLKRKTEEAKRSTYTIASAKPEDIAAFRLTFLEHVIDGLCNLWYLNEELVSRKSKALWKNGNAPDREHVTFPSYCFTERIRYRIQAFLGGSEAEIGRRLLKGKLIPPSISLTNWDDCCDKVLKFMALKKENNLGVLKQKKPVILSPVHGDLNANNVFLWLKSEKFPFLIDLPFYQDKGHAMQDFARLEVELKFVLMDRQEDSPPEQLPAFDETPVQIPLWWQLENRLLDGGGGDWYSVGFKDNVVMTYQLVELIRRKAKMVQQQEIPGSAPDEFESEYLPALLYHTIRAISYTSLSIFKRLLAVYSAGSILRKLGL
jgi:hypothetical protein